MGWALRTVGKKKKTDLQEQVEPTRNTKRSYDTRMSGSGRRRRLGIRVGKRLHERELVKDAGIISLIHTKQPNAETLERKLCRVEAEHPLSSSPSGLHESCIRVCSLR